MATDRDLRAVIVFKTDTPFRLLLGTSTIVPLLAGAKRSKVRAVLDGYLGLLQELIPTLVSDERTSLV